MLHIKEILPRLRGLPVPVDRADLEVFKQKWALPADQHPAKVYVASLGTGPSRRSMRSALDTCAYILSMGAQTTETLPWHQLRYQHTAALRSVLLERYKPATVNKYLAAIRGVLLECWRLGFLDSETYHRARAVKWIHLDTLPPGRHIARGEIRLLFESCAEDSTPRGRRDAAAIALLYGLGLRRTEAVTLQLNDYSAENRQVMVRQGKRFKDRIVHAGPGAFDAIEDWLETRGIHPGPLLVPIFKDGVMEYRAMTSQALYEAMLRRAVAANVDRFTPHDFRRTYAGELLDAGADLNVVRALMGHTSVLTTARYDRRGEPAKAHAAALLPVPYVRRKPAPDVEESPTLGGQEPSEGDGEG